MTFLFPPTTHSLRLQAPTLPWRYSREAGLCSARNFKAHASSFFSCLPSQSLASFICVLSLLLNQYLYLFLLFLSLCLLLSVSTSSLSCSRPSFFLTPHLSSSDSHQPDNIKGISPPLVGVIYPGSQAGRRAGGFHAKARYPQGRIQISMETLHLIWPREEKVGKSNGPNKELCHTWWNIWTDVGEMYTSC